MRYMLLIYSDENGDEQKMSEAEMGRLMAEYGRFHEDIMASGCFKGAERLRPSPMATTVRVRSGEVITTDGPFAETKEHLGGYYEIEVKDLDEAVAWAARIPTSTYGSIEIRPIWES